MHLLKAFYKIYHDVHYDFWQNVSLFFTPIMSVSFYAGRSKSEEESRQNVSCKLKIYYIRCSAVGNRTVTSDTYMYLLILYGIVGFGLVYTVYFGLVYGMF